MASKRKTAAPVEGTPPAEQASKPKAPPAKDNTTRVERTTKTGVKVVSYMAREPR